MGRDNLVFVLVILMALFTVTAIHEKRTSDYWRNEYDQQNRAINEIVADKTDPSKVRIPVAIMLAKTCIDRYGNETAPIATVAVVFTANTQPAGKVVSPRCPKGTIDTNIYVGRQ